MKFENTQVFNFEGALRGMRNPKNSWAKSDSYYDDDKYVIGENDMRLATTLTKAGRLHSTALASLLQVSSCAPPILLIFFYVKQF